jgi:hypothetical protein
MDAPISKLATRSALGHVSLVAARPAGDPAAAGQDAHGHRHIAGYALASLDEIGEGQLAGDASHRIDLSMSALPHVRRAVPVMEQLEREEHGSPPSELGDRQTHPTERRRALTYEIKHWIFCVH